MKKRTIFVLIVILSVASGLIFSEAKAEPNRIKFSKGELIKELTGSLQPDEEYEFIFAAKKGQKIYITNSDSNKFAYLVSNEAGFSRDSIDLAEPTMEFFAPKTGDYLLIIRRFDKKPKSANFSVTLAIN